MKSQRWAPPRNLWVDESKRWAPLWVDADSKKCQICVVQMTKKPGTLFLSYTLSTQGVPTSRYNFSGTGGNKFLGPDKNTRRQNLPQQQGLQLFG